VALHASEKKRESVGREKNCVAKNNQNWAGATPLFGLSAAQKVFGVAPALGTVAGASDFFPPGKDLLNSNLKGGNTMSIIKKAPAILTREFRLEEPVSLLLDDYAQFIESSADHVLNSAIKKTLWRDQDYRKWREQKRNADGPAARRGSEAVAKS
jgi:hypothetical protein